MSRRVAIVSDAASYVGPDLARVLADRGHDLVVGDPDDGLVAELEARGAAVEVVEQRPRPRRAGGGRAARRRRARPLRTDRLRHRVHRPHRRRPLPQVQRRGPPATLAGCVEAPYRFLRTVVPTMVEQGGGQVLVFTSAAGGPAHPRSAALLLGPGRGEHARAQRRRRGGGQGRAGQRDRHELHGLPRLPGGQPGRGRRRAAPAWRPRCRWDVSAGSTSWPTFSAAFVDGTSRFATGQFVAFDGGWSG